MVARLILCVFFLALSGCMVDTGPDEPFVVDRETPPRRLDARSPWYNLENQKARLYVNYCGWDTERRERITDMEISDKVNRMVADADEMIIGTFFLFDNLYADEPAGDYVKELSDLLIARKLERPSMPVILILDLIHKGWGHRRSEVVERLRKAGVDIFYSDLLQTRSATRLGIWEGLNQAGRTADVATFGLLGVPWDLFGRIPIPGVKFDRDLVTFGAIANAASLKANHRKALVIKRRGVYEALTTSWNPHNPSMLHENYALSVTGPLACYEYMQLREDVRHSLALGRGFVSLSGDTSNERHRNFLKWDLPALPDSAWHDPPEAAPQDKTSPRPQAAIATEEAIEPILMQWLHEVDADDRVRIQMFYLSRVPVVNAILDAARRTRHPIQLLLDPNRTGINYEKDGTPNAQVADYLLERAKIEHANIEIRWYSTHGEQNHAKAITITNEKTGKYLLSLGSANWTRKNLAGINLENDVFVRNSAELNRQFNGYFDRFWNNTDPGVQYSVAYDDPRYHYNRHEERDRWAIPRRSFFFWPKYDAAGRPELLEQEVVHW